MKYFAILKDSFREALDSWIIYVMFGLSTLVVLFVATMTFEPGEPSRLLQSLPQGYIMGLPMHESRTAVRKPAELENSHILCHGYETSDGGPATPASELKVLYGMRIQDLDARKKVQADPKIALDFVRKRLELVEDLEIFKVVAIQRADGKKAWRHLLAPAPQAPAKTKNPEVDAKAELEALQNDFYFEVHLQPAAATLPPWPHRVGIFFGAVELGDNEPLGLVLFTISSLVFRIGAWVAILVGVIITAFFIPNMLRKGTIDLLLVKPIHRWALLCYKYLGGLTFIFLNTAVAIGGIWLVLGLRSGVWANGFLFIIFGITYYFAILYAVSTLFGVMTQSAVVSILVTCVAWGLFFVIGILYHVFEDDRQRRELARKQNPMTEVADRENAFHTIIRVIYPVTPRTADLTLMMTDVLYRDFFSARVAEKLPLIRSEIRWKESLAVSGGFIALMLALSCWWFATRDY